MTTRDVTLSDVEAIRANPREADEALQMDEEAFRAFYERTARSLWVYLSRITGDAQAADDLLQESYYRFLKTRRAYEGDGHRRNYLFRIATNLVRDAHRRARPGHVPLREDGADAARVDDDSGRTEQRTDLARAMGHLKPRDRDLLWLAYAQGLSHQEIAGALGVKAGSVKLLLFRARRRLARLLRAAGLSGGRQGGPRP